MGKQTVHNQAAADAMHDAIEQSIECLHHTGVRSMKELSSILHRLGDKAAAIYRWENGND